MLKKSDINLKEWEFEFQQRNYQPILMSDLFCRSLYNKYQKEISLPVDKLDYLFTSLGKGYVKSIQKKKILKELRVASKNKEDYLRYVLKRTLERIKELDDFADSIKDKIDEKISAKDINKLWKKFDSIFLTVIPWFFIPWYIAEENILSDKVKKKLLEYKGEIENITNFDNALMALIFPRKKALFQEEQKHFLKLVEIAKNSKDFKKNKSFIKEAKTYLEKYSWMKTYLILPIEPLSMKELMDRIEDALKNKFIEEYQTQRFKRLKDERLADKIMKKIKNDKELIRFIKLTQEFGWLLTFSTEQSLIAMSKLIPFFKKISERIRVPYSQWVYLTSKEITDMLEGNLMITAAELRKRQLGYVFLMNNGMQKILTGSKGNKVSEWIDKNIGSVNKKTTEFKGQTASPGIIKGKIKIILFAKDAYLIKRGEILVCSMTSPDYISAMQKSAAILTDEGGLLSHAAIVSRELGKPCIIGTKIATKVLKDGDLVEVDANKGIIKILTKDEKD